MSEENTYQPKWEKHKEYQNSKHRHHHHYSNGESDKYTNSWGGAMKMRDRKAYHGLMFIIILALAFGAYRLVMLYVEELRALPMDDPNAELKVDELRIHKAEEQDAIIAGDSLARAYNLDSIKRTVQIDTRPVYRPPRRENTWYITKREWRAIWRNYKVWRWEKKREREEENDIRRKENSSRDSE